MEIQDVRLVYAPPAGIGNFGGETDNWQWPRHTGDWSFYRAYVSKDGKAVPFSKENVPYKPKHWLKVSPAGANPGDLVFVAGYPGRTFRLNPYEEVKETVEWSLPRSIKRSTDRIAILEKLGKDDKETALRVAQSIRGLNNGLTKNKGVLQGMVKGGLLSEKEAEEKDFVKWIDADAGPQGEVRRRDPRDQRAHRRAREDARAQRAPHGALRASWARRSARRRRSTASRSRRRRRTPTATRRSRSATGPACARARSAPSARSTRRPTAPSCATRSPTSRSSRPTSGSRPSTRRSA